MLVCMILATSDVIPCSKLGNREMSTRVSRLKPIPPKFACDDPCEVFSKAQDVRSYLNLGGTRETMRYEVAMGHIHVGDARFDTSSWIEDLIQSRSELDSSFYTWPDLSSQYITTQAESQIEKANSAYLLWDIGLTSAYDLIRSHHRVLPHRR